MLPGIKNAGGMQDTILCVIQPSSFSILQKTKIKTNQTKRSLKINWSVVTFGIFWERTNLVKNPPAMRETWVWSLAWEDLEEGMAAPSSILAWRIPWMEEPGGLQSMGLQRVGHDWSDLAHGTAQATYSYKDMLLCDIYWAPHDIFKGLFPVFPGSHKLLIMLQHCSDQRASMKSNLSSFLNHPCTDSTDTLRTALCFPV